MSDFWQETVRGAIELRQTLHQNPELGWQEWQTAERIRAQLSELNIPWRTCAETGTVALLNKDAKHRGPHIALRADIDALPITETTHKPYQSQTPGCMHACGHDGHTATLVATAAWLKHHEADLKGPVSLIFQPAEEGGHGAKKMIEDGALEGVDKIFGWHSWPSLPFGYLLCPDTLVMCGNGVFRIEITGRGGHASEPHHCANPVLAASAITLNLEQVVSRFLPATEPAVVAVTAIEAPSGPTVIPERAVVSGSVRVPNESVRQRLAQAISEVAQTTAATYGVTCNVNVERRYGVTINHPHCAAEAREFWASFAQEDSVFTQGAANAHPVMASEDFSYYLEKIPGAFCLIGADDGPDHQHACHNPNFDFNDRLLPIVARFYSALVGAPLPDPTYNHNALEAKL